MQCLGLDQLCEVAVSKAQLPDISNVRCTVLGQARLPAALGATGPGRTIALHVMGARVVYLLCAHVHQGIWLCHRGSYTDGHLDDNPFHEQDLVRKDIEEEAWDTRLTKRIRSTSAMNTLRALVQDSDYAWCELVAVARFRAAELRSQLTGNPLDEEATQGFERNPWMWRPTGEWASQSRISFLWSWAARDGTSMRVFEHALLNNLVQRSVPIPRSMNQKDLDFFRQLVAVADMETRLTKAPCKYLGIQLSPGSYEPDPHLWPAAALAQQKSHASVIYEWQYVTTAGKPHTVTCRVNHVVYGGRRVSMNPFRSCPTGLHFDIAFFEAVGKLVREGIQYRGVAYESERPEIRAEVPKEGLDVQHEPV